MTSSLYLCIACVGFSYTVGSSVACPLPVLPAHKADSTLCADSLARIAPHHSPDHHHEPIEVGEAIAVAQRRSVSINSVSTRLDNRHILSNMGLSLAQSLQAVSGTSMVQTGANVAKPVIQGMHSTRVLIVNNGARQTGQQWGVEHAPELDLQSAQQLYVVKGAESVRYGSEALGGIVLLEQTPLPYHQHKLQGQVGSLYASNGQRYQIVARAESAFPFASQWAWRLSGNYANSGDRHTAHYILNNTAARESNLQAALGYHSQGFTTEFTFSRYTHKYGVLPSAQMGNEQLLTERIKIGRPTFFTPWTRSIDYPYQQTAHYNATLKLTYNNHTWGNWKWLTAYQHNLRNEHRFRRQNHSSIPATALRLNSLQQQLHWKKTLGAWSSEAGAQWLYINNYNQAGTGVVPIIPNYTEQSLGFYTLGRYRQNSFTAEAGIRLDHQRTKAAGYDWTGLRYGDTHRFTNLSYTLAAHYHLLPQLTATSNFGVAWRAPHVYELYSNGNELGSGIYVVGNQRLGSEQGYKWINSLAYTPKYWKIQLDAWVQWIDNYIYDQPTHEVRTVISGSYPVFAYRQTAALLRGIDLDLRYMPHTSLTYRLVASALWANERNTGTFLPYMPPPRLTQSLQYTPHWHIAPRLSFSLQHHYVSHQKRFDPSTDLIAYAPPAYHLLGAEIYAEWFLTHGQKLKVALMGSNLLNTEYKDYTNRSRYYAHDLGRDLRLIATWHF